MKNSCPLCRTSDSIKPLTSSLTGGRISKTGSCRRSSATVWTTSSVRILSDWRRFEPTGVFDITGVCGSVDSTHRPLDDVDELLVCQRKVKWACCSVFSSYHPFKILCMSCVHWHWNRFLAPGGILDLSFSFSRQAWGSCTCSFTEQNAPMVNVLQKLSQPTSVQQFFNTLV